MKQWKRKWFILVLLCMFSYGCGQTEETLEEELEETSNIIPVVITPMAEPTIMEGEISEVAEGTIARSETGFPINRDIVIDIDACNAVNRKLTRDMESGASLFCLDKEMEVVYFVNQNQDNYLYRMEEGNVELVVALPVKEVYPWEDSVYFMIESYDRYELGEKKDGDIYRYIPETKEVELVYALGAIEGAENHKMTVNEQGIHFNYSETISSKDGITRVKVSSYTLPFDSSEPVKDTMKRGKAGWKDYYFSYQFSIKDNTTPVEVALVSRTEETNDIIPLEIGEFQYCVVNNTIYSIGLGNSSISLFDLESRKGKNYNFRTGIISANQYLKEDIEKSFGEEMEELCSFTITENGTILWATDGEYLYRMNTKDKIIHYLTTIDGNHKIGNLYTDGRQVYGLYASEQTGVPRLVRFCIEEIEKNHGKRVIEVEYLVPEGEEQ